MGKAQTKRGVEYDVADSYHHGYLGSEPIPEPTDLHRLAKAVVRLEAATESAEQTVAMQKSHLDESYRHGQELQRQLAGAEDKVDSLAQTVRRFVTPEVERLIRERERQEMKWTREHDDEHTWSEWTGLIVNRCSLIADTARGDPIAPGDVEDIEIQHLLVEIGALALAALEAQARR